MESSVLMLAVPLDSLFTAIVAFSLFTFTMLPPAVAAVVIEEGVIPVVTGRAVGPLLERLVGPPPLLENGGGGWFPPVFDDLTPSSSKFPLKAGLLVPPRVLTISCRPDLVRFIFILRPLSASLSLLKLPAAALAAGGLEPAGMYIWQTLASQPPGVIILQNTRRGGGVWVLRKIIKGKGKKDNIA